MSFRFNTAGARKFGDYTADNIGAPFAIVLDDEVVSAPTIQSHIPGGSGIITGNFTSKNLPTWPCCCVLVPCLPSSTSSKNAQSGQSWGKTALMRARLQRWSPLRGPVLHVRQLWLVWYLCEHRPDHQRGACCLVLLSLIGATLTLPGIAGIVLTVGMAVDANVLIFERIREELETAKGPRARLNWAMKRRLARFWMPTSPPSSLR